MVVWFPIEVSLQKKHNSKKGIQRKKKSDPTPLPIYLFLFPSLCSAVHYSLAAVYRKRVWTVTRKPNPLPDMALVQFTLLYSQTQPIRVSIYIFFIVFSPPNCRLNNIFMLVYKEKVNIFDANIFFYRFKSVQKRLKRQNIG